LTPLILVEFAGNHRLSLPPRIDLEETPPSRSNKLKPSRPVMALEPSVGSHAWATEEKVANAATMALKEETMIEAEKP
jgi:hypothetical protein